MDVIARRCWLWPWLVGLAAGCGAQDSGADHSARVSASGSGTGVVTRATVEPMAEWTILVYMNGDNSLEAAAVADFKEMARVVNPAQKVRVVVQFDRGNEKDLTEPDWSDTWRFVVRQNTRPIP